MYVCVHLFLHLSNPLSHLPSNELILLPIKSQSVHPPTHVQLHSSHPSTCQSIYHLPMRPAMCLSIYKPTHLFVYPSIYQPIHLNVSLSILYTYPLSLSIFVLGILSSGTGQFRGWLGYTLSCSKLSGEETIGDFLGEA